MYSRKNTIVTLVVTFLCGQGLGFWPFDYNFYAHVAVYAKSDASETVYSESNAKRIAIIGAGAAGSSTAFYLHKFASESGLDINVTVFERSSYVGGRSTTVNAYDDPNQPVELGASIFVEVNAILQNTSLLLGLNSTDSETETSELLGIWNSEKFVFTQKEGSWAWLDIAKLIWKYGLSPIRTQRLMKSVVGKFLKLYEHPAFPFRSLSERAHDLDLVSVTSVTGDQFLSANGIGTSFSTEIIQASTRVNYASNLNLIHGLETMVCMAIEGARSIKGGNWQIFDGMLKHSNASLSLNTTINSISKNKDKYILGTSFKDSTTTETYSNQESFNTVVLAAPLQFSDIDIENGLLKLIPDKIPYVTLHVTLFTSSRTFDPIYFGLAPDQKAPTTILTTLPPGEITPDPENGVGPTGFFSISTLHSTINPKTGEKEYLYKIFSPRAVTSEFLSDIFGVPIPKDLSSINLDSGDAISWYYPHTWYSYPYEYPRVTFEGPELGPGFYYTSGIESFISTMETSALMGMNVARLIVDDYAEDWHANTMDNLQQTVLSEGANGLDNEEL